MREGVEREEGTGSERKRRYLVDPASSHMLVLKIKPCMPRYRWTKNRDCGWLIKSVRISLVKRGMEKDNPVNCRANTRRRYFMVVTPVE